MHLRKNLFLFVSLLFLLSLGSCGKETAAEKIFHAGPEEVLDSTCSWLDVSAHFHKKNYYEVFNAYYEQQLQKKNYVQAGKALQVVADQEIYYLSFDTAFQSRLQLFDSLYAGRLPWYKKLFIASHLGNRQMDQGEFRKAIATFKEVTDHQPFNYHTFIEIAYLFGDMAFCYSAIGDQEKALFYNQKALHLFGRTDDLTGKGMIYNNMALVHLFTKNYTEAEIDFDKAMHIYMKSQDMSNLLTTMHNRILLYQETGDLRQYELIDSTYHFFVDQQLEDPSLEVAISSFYVEKLLHENKMEEAKKVLESMLLPLEKLHLSTMNDDYNIALAQYELKTGGILNKELIENALRVVEKTEHYQNQMAFCEVLKKDALLRKDYKMALLYSEKEKKAMDNLANREMIVKTMELNQKHQTEKKEQHIVLQEETIQKKNIAIALLVVVLVAFCLIAATISSRQKQKKIRAEAQRAILYTRQLLEKTEEERKRIAGDLHDSVSHELLNLKNSIRESDNQTGSKIDAIINDIRIISRNLHPVMFEKIGLAASVEQLVERAQSIYNLMVSADIRYDSFLSVSDELQVYRIIQEALSNTIKYADAFAAKIVLQTRSEVLYIEFRDNGKGFDLAEKMAGSTAFGLHNIFERSKALGGFAKIHSDQNGTVITIEIKKPV